MPVFMSPTDVVEGLNLLDRKKGTKRMDAMKNRTVLNMKGEMLASAIFMTGKVTPQIKAIERSTRSA
jgi:hypothetical protein